MSVSIKGVFHIGGFDCVCTASILMGRRVARCGKLLLVYDYGCRIMGTRDEKTVGRCFSFLKNHRWFLSCVVCKKHISLECANNCRGDSLLADMWFAERNRECMIKER